MQKEHIAEEVEQQESATSDSELVGQALEMVESLFTYFETLSIYWQKLLNQKISRLVGLLVATTLFLFVICSGLSFLLYAAYQALLPILGNAIDTSLIMGSSLVVFAAISMYWLIRKMEV
ncbi:MAG: hypothetical protein AAF518_27955 [Spirochaetota bacterium]